MEKSIYREIDQLYGHRVVMKGLNALERGKTIAQHWGEFRQPVAVGIDAKRFDQHTTTSALKYEHAVYLRHCPASEKRQLARLLRMQLRTKGYMYTEEGIISYTIKRGRCSGDMNTSSGNIIIMTHLTYDYLKSLNIKFRFINDGDDGVIFIEKSDLSKLGNMYEWYEQYGYKMQAEAPVSILERVEFCQCQPVWNGEEWLMCRKPDVVLNRDAYTTKSVQTKGAFDYYRSAIGTCGVAALGGMPVLNAFYEALRRGAKIIDDPDPDFGGIYWMSRDMNLTGRSVTPLARYSFYLAFDISPDEQVQLERMYSAYTPQYEPSGVHQYDNR
jgi:hypothetical protein